MDSFVKSKKKRDKLLVQEISLFKRACKVIKALDLRFNSIDCEVEIELIKKGFQKKEKYIERLYNHLQQRQKQIPLLKSNERQKHLVEKKIIFVKCQITDRQNLRQIYCIPWKAVEESIFNILFKNIINFLVHLSKSINRIFQIRQEMKINMGELVQMTKQQECILLESMKTFKRIQIKQSRQKLSKRSLSQDQAKASLSSRKHHRKVSSSNIKHESYPQYTSQLKIVQSRVTEFYKGCSELNYKINQNFRANRSMDQNTPKSLRDKLKQVQQRKYKILQKILLAEFNTKQLQDYLLTNQNNQRGQNRLRQLMDEMNKSTSQLNGVKEEQKEILEAFSQLVERTAERIKKFDQGFQKEKLKINILFAMALIACSSISSNIQSYKA